MIAYACEPHSTSEGLVGWELASRIARRHHVTLLTRPKARNDIERLRAEDPGMDLEVEYHELGFLRSLKKAPPPRQQPALPRLEPSPGDQSRRTGEERSLRSRPSHHVGSILDAICRGGHTPPAIRLGPGRRSRATPLGFGQNHGVAGEEPRSTSTRRSETRSARPDDAQVPRTGVHGRAIQ